MVGITTDKRLWTAAGVGALFAAGSFFFLYQKANEIETKSRPAKVLIATTFIPPGTPLRPEMVESRDIPGAYIGPSAIQDIKEVEGLTTLAPLSAGEQVLSNKFGSNEPSLALSLSPGRRAYTLEVNETSGVGGLVHSGDHVDILAKLTNGRQEMTSFVFQDLRVLAVGQRLERPAKTKGDSEGAAPDPYSTITLEVTPEQAETLLFLDGRPLRLVLRAPGDGDLVDIGPRSESEVLNKLGHFSPAIRRGLQIIRAGEGKER